MASSYTDIQIVFDRGALVVRCLAIVIGIWVEYKYYEQIILYLFARMKTRVRECKRKCACEKEKDTERERES